MDSGPMMEEDEKKPFDAETMDREEESQPDPDEPLKVEEGTGRVWLVRIPPELMERWSKIDEDGVHLASIRVYQRSKAPHSRNPRIMLRVPPPPGRPEDEAEEYELDMLNESVENQIVVAEREKAPGTGSRARLSILTGRVKHDCSLRPILNDRYRQRMKMRTAAANTPKRTIMRIEDAHPGGRAGINRLTSGVTNASGFTDLVKPKPKPPKGQFERMARMPRDALLDLLFSLFREKEHWSIKPLRERTQQPEVYLKEVLNEIAFLHRSGEHNGQWELMANFKGDGIKSENVPLPPEGSMLKMEEDGFDEDEDDDEDEDMEEVS
ncbi:transcription initiation factor IIF beta subunit [Panus rudis PR-1116 ss-1]|nr:transcription initiation factor IIF beta subunit [Panus rudis PR-1116 ss-1]